MGVEVSSDPKLEMLDSAWGEVWREGAGETVWLWGGGEVCGEYL